MKHIAITFAFVSLVQAGGALASDCATDIAFGKPFSEQFSQGFQRCFYLGIGAGGSRKTPTIESDRGFELDGDYDSAFQLYIGRRLSYRWFVEGGYSYLGQADLRSDDPLAVSENRTKVSIDYHGLSLFLGRYLFNDKRYGWNPFARVGYVFIRSESGDTALFTDSNNHNVQIGGGIDYRFKDAPWFLRAAADFYEEDVQAATLSFGRYLGGRSAKGRDRSKVLDANEAASPDNGLTAESEMIAASAEPEILEEEAVTDISRSDLQRERDCQLLDEPAEGVVFAPGSAELASQSISALGDYVKALLNNPDLMVEVAAHTSRTGNGNDDKP